MCGRYVLSACTDDLMKEFDAQLDARQAALAADHADYNVAPTKPVRAIAELRSGEEGAPARKLRSLHWGLVPPWAKDQSAGSKLINARVETVAEKPSFRRAFKKQRCLLPADGYYEWHAPGRAQRRQPYFLHPPGGGMLALAGIYELWHDPSRSRDDPDAWLASTAILTTEARGDVATLHHRMPLTVQRDNYAAWLDADNTDPSQLHALLDPPHERLAAYPVSTAVNNVRANGRHLLERVAAGTVGATGTAAAEPGEDALF